MRRRLWIGLLLSVMIFSGGCRLFRRQKPAVAPPPAPKVTAPASEPKQEPVPAPPQLPTPEVGEIPGLPQAPEQAPVPPPPKAKRASKPRPRPPAPAEAAPPVAQAPAAKLGEVLSADQRAAYLRVLDRDLAAARQALARLQGRTLSPGQAETASRVRAFILQAEQIRESDLRTAAQLAQRAALLAKDLH